MKIKTSRAKRFFSKIAEETNRHFIVSVFMLFLIAAFIGTILFYKYVFLAEKKGEKNVSSFLSIKQEVYQGVLEFWQEQEQRFKNIDSKEYIDPFKKPTPPVPVKAPVKK
jgi:hypothetical protein